MSSSRIKMAALARALAPTVVTNDDLSRVLDTSDEWIRTRTGVAERRRAEPGVYAADLGAEAAEKALAASGLKAEDIGVLVVATATPDRLLPSVACDIQARIGAHNAAAFDIAAACSGFIYGLQLAEGMIVAGQTPNILLVCAERLSSIVDWTDRSTCVLFGDGAAAAVITASDDPARGLLASYSRSDGRLADILQRPGRLPVQAESLSNGDHYVKMDGKAVFKSAVTAMSEAVERVLDKAGVSIADIDAFIPHQANIRIIEALSQRVGVPDDKVVINLQRYGNMSSASVPVALIEAIEAGRLGEGSLVLMTAAGAGMTWGGALVRL